MGNYDPENVVWRPKGLEVLAEVIEKETYASETAEKTGINRSMVSEILNSFEKRDIIRQSKRGRAKHYELNENGLAEYTLEMWKDQYEEDIFEKYDKCSEKEILEGLKSFLPPYLKAMIKEDVNLEYKNLSSLLGVDELYNFLMYIFALNDYDVDKTAEYWNMPSGTIHMFIAASKYEAEQYRKYGKYFN